METSAADAASMSALSDVVEIFGRFGIAVRGIRKLFVFVSILINIGTAGGGGCKSGKTFENGTIIRKIDRRLTKAY